MRISFAVFFCFFFLRITLEFVGRSSCHKFRDLLGLGGSLFVSQAIGGTTQGENLGELKGEA